MAIARDLRLGLFVASGLFAATLCSWARFVLSGTLKVTSVGGTGDLLLGLAFAAAFAFAGLSYLALLVGDIGPLRRPLAGVALLVHLSSSPALPLTSNDAFSNLAYGRLLALGSNPAVRSAADLGRDDPFGQMVDSYWRERSSVYGPVLNALSGACALTGGLVSALLCFKLLFLAMALATVLAAYGFCRGLEEEAGRAFCLVSMNPLLAWEVSGQAHNDGLMVLAAAASLWAIQKGRLWLALFLLVVGFAAKFAVAPLLLLFLVFVLRRSALRGLLMAGAAAALLAALFLPMWAGAASLSGPAFAARQSQDHAVNSLGFLPLIASRTLAPRLERPFFVLWVTATSAFLAVRALVYARRATSLDAVVAGALAFTLLYECLGMLWYEPWYATWLLPLAMACRSERLRGTVALYTTTVPLLYHPTELYGVATLGSHGLALALLAGLGDRVFYAPARRLLGLPDTAGRHAS